LWGRRRQAEVFKEGEGGVTPQRPGKGIFFDGGPGQKSCLNKIREY